MDRPELNVFQRIALAFWAFFAVLFRREVAAELAGLRARRRAQRLSPARGAPIEPAPVRPAEASPLAQAPPPPAEGASRPPPKEGASHPPPKEGASPEGASPEGASRRAALQLLSALQREGRLVDFVEEDLTGFPDAAVGAAARTVHAGCKRALQELFRLEPVMREAEGATVEVATGFDPAAVRLTGNVVGKPPFRGSLRHHGWRARTVNLPRTGDGVDPAADGGIVAPAEVEL